MNIVIPMAGRGSRLRSEQLGMIKPLRLVQGRPMIQIVIENIRPTRAHNFIFICRREHLQDYQLETLLTAIAPDCKIVALNEVSSGPASTVLAAKKFIDNRQPLMIANCDQWIDFSIDRYLDEVDSQAADGTIMTMRANGPLWSYVATDKSGRVRQVAEKIEISDMATVGIYNFSRGSDFVTAAEAMISRDIRTNGEFYVAPVFNELIRGSKEIMSYSIGNVYENMFALGTSEDLEFFLNHNSPKDIFMKS